MEVAFVAHASPGEFRFRHATGNAGLFLVGDSLPEDHYCERILDGRIPYLTRDTTTEPEVADLSVTHEMKIGCHVSVPVILSDGSIYGTFCCFGSEADDTLTERDVRMMHAFAAVAAAQIEGDITDSEIKVEALGRIYSTIHNESLSIVYQPIYRLDTNVPVGVECLARFPDGAFRPPSEWFAEASELGLGIDLELTAIQAALRGLAALPSDIYLSINASPDTIVSGRLAEALKDVPRDRLVIEVTEHAIILDYAGLRKSLEPLREIARIAIDDAGAGNAGFRQIVDIRPDIIKLDMSLTRGINSDPRRASLASALVTYGHDMEGIIVAEGIETSAELNTLRKLGVECGQGYFLSRPFPIAHAAEFFSAPALAKPPSSSPDGVTVAAAKRLGASVAS